MKKPFIVGNWKMNKTISEARALVQELKQELAKLDPSQFSAVVVPPYTALGSVAEACRNSPLQVGGQDLFWESAGAFTGAISAPLLKEAGANFVLVGHSERRQFFHETDRTVNQKIHAALAHDLVPIVCVGETLQERESGSMAEVITTQLRQGLAGLAGAACQKLIIAYEPVWAIGTGQTATKEQAEEVHEMIRRLLSQDFTQGVAQGVKILYGGSVKPANSQELLAQPNIDGALVGGASLKAEEFVSIITQAL